MEHAGTNKNTPKRPHFPRRNDVMVFTRFADVLNKGSWSKPLKSPLFSLRSPIQKVPTTETPCTLCCCGMRAANVLLCSRVSKNVTPITNVSSTLLLLHIACYIRCFFLIISILQKSAKLGYSCCDRVVIAIVTGMTFKLAVVALSKSGLCVSMFLSRLAFSLRIDVFAMVNEYIETNVRCQRSKPSKHLYLSSSPYRQFIFRPEHSSVAIQDFVLMMRDELIATANGDRCEVQFIVFGPGREQDVKLLPCWFETHPPTWGVARFGGAWPVGQVPTWEHFCVGSGVGFTSVSRTE